MSREERSGSTAHVADTTGAAGSPRVTGSAHGAGSGTTRAGSAGAATSAPRPTPGC
jgi:hypothetical protein